VNKLIILAITTLTLLVGCDYTQKDLDQATQRGYARGLENGEKIGFTEGAASVSKAAEYLVAENRMKFEVRDAQQELILEKALACSHLPINICPDSWMVNIESYQKNGYSGNAGPQSFWITLTGWLVPTLLLGVLSLLLAITYKYTELSEMAKEKKRLKVFNEELNVERSKLACQLANVGLEEKQLLEELRRDIKVKKENLKQVRLSVEEEQKGLEQFRSDIQIEITESMQKINELESDVSALEAQKKLFGG